MIAMIIAMIAIVFAMVFVVTEVVTDMVTTSASFFRAQKKSRGATQTFFAYVHAAPRKEKSTYAHAQALRNQSKN